MMSFIAMHINVARLKIYTSLSKNNLLEEKLMEEKTKFVTVEMSRKQVLTDKPVHNEKTDKDYVRCLMPDGGSFWYPTESLKIKESDSNVVYFSRPKGTEFQVKYSNKVENGASENEYESTTKTYTIEEIAEKFKSNSAFIGLDISSKLVKEFNSKDGREWAAVKIPVLEENVTQWYEIIVPRNRCMESKEDAENKVYLSLFVNGTDGKPYTFQATRDVYNPNNDSYDKVTKEMTSKEVIKAFKDSNEAYEKRVNNDKTIASELANGR